jgi:hypothetical protein
MDDEVDNLFEQARRGARRGKRVGAIRRFVAYVLKIVAGGGSLVVATGYRHEWDQQIGIAILIAIFLDTLSSNHTRLLAEVQAGYAFNFLSEKIKREYNRSLNPLYEQYGKLVNAGADVRLRQPVQQSIETLQQKTHKELADGIGQIEARLAEADLKALEGLALDNERAAAQQGRK